MRWGRRRRARTAPRSCDCAAPTAEPPPPPTGAAAPWTPSAPSVCGPTTPSTSSPCARLERAHRAPRLAPEHAVGADAERALDRDRGRCRKPLVDRAAPAAPAAERPARGRPDDAVDLEPVRGLERADRAPGLAPEHAVGGDPEHALDLGDRRPARADAQELAGGRARHLGALGPRGLVGRGEHRHADQRRRDERLLLAVGARAPRGGRLTAPDRAGQRALPQVGAAKVAATRWLRTDRPAVVEQVHAAMEPGRPDGLMNRLDP